MTNADELIERAGDIEFRLRCEAKHMTADLIRDLAAEVRELRELLLGALDIIHTPYYDMMARQIQFQERIEEKANEIRSFSVASSADH